jgi:hypothetical protein
LTERLWLSDEGVVLSFRFSSPVLLYPLPPLSPFSILSSATPRHFPSLSRRNRSLNAVFFPSLPRRNSNINFVSTAEREGSGPRCRRRRYERRDTLLPLLPITSPTSLLSPLVSFPPALTSLPLTPLSQTSMTSRAKRKTTTTGPSYVDPPAFAQLSDLSDFDSDDNDSGEGSRGKGKGAFSGSL